MKNARDSVTGNVTHGCVIYIGILIKQVTVGKVGI